MESILFTLDSYRYLGDQLVREQGFAAGEIEQRQFPDGERYRRLVTPIAGKSVILLGGTIDDASTLELFDLGCAAVKNGAAALTLAIPYFGYSTMERAVNPGEVVTAKCRARLLSAIPIAPNGNRVLLLDLHSEGIPHYFEGGVRPVHLYGKPVITALIRKLGGTDIVLACTDAGRAKWVQSLANDLGISAAFIFKRRLDGSRTEVSAVSAQVEGRTVVIYDDMIRTGGSLLNAGRAYRDAGARRLVAICTHGIFPGDALARIKASGLFDHIACTDSHPRSQALAGNDLTVATIAEIYADELRVTT
jgi:ribose-phosphate pyrophosphokinase